MRFFRTSPPLFASLAAAPASRKHQFASILCALLASLGAVSPSAAGTLDAYEFSPSIAAPVTTLQANITYSRPAGAGLPANETQVGFIVGDPASGVLLRQASGNTLNRVTVTIEASVTDPAETLTFRQPEFYLAGLPAECAWDNTPANPKTITCFFRKTTPGFTFPSFVVFYNAPAFAGNNGVGDLAGSDKISTKVRVQYSEGTNGGDPSPTNSSQEAPQPGLVTLGTVDPVNIKSAVAKGGASLYTGDGGAPKNEPDKRQTELLTVPTLPGQYTVAEVLITKDKDTDSTLGGSNCLTAGNLKECPAFTTTIADPFTPTVTTRFLTTPLKLVYRMDGSNLKRNINQILNSVEIRYSGEKTDANGASIGVWSDQPVGLCASGGVPRADGLPCVALRQCFRNLAATSSAYNAIGRNAELVGDCEWVLVNNGNGFTRFQ